MRPARLLGSRALALARLVGDAYGEVIPGLYAGSLVGNIGILNPTSGQVVTALTGAFALGYIAGQDAAQQEPRE